MSAEYNPSPEGNPNRNGRYRRFRHANSLSKRKPTVLNLMTPRNLLLPNVLSNNSLIRQLARSSNLRDFRS